MPMSTRQNCACTWSIHRGRSVFILGGVWAVGSIFEVFVLPEEVVVQFCEAIGWTRPAQVRSRSYGRCRVVNFCGREITIEALSAVTLQQDRRIRDCNLISENLGAVLIEFEMVNGNIIGRDDDVCIPRSKTGQHQRYVPRTRRCSRCEVTWTYIIKSPICSHFKVLSKCSKFIEGSMNSCNPVMFKSDYKDTDAKSEL
jgi:hypothetical protein